MAQASAMSPRYFNHRMIELVSASRYARGRDANRSSVLVQELLYPDGVAGYLRGESLDFTRTVRDDAEARYRKRFR